MGGGGDTSQSNTSQPHIPAGLIPYFQQGEQQLIGAQGNLPDISQLYAQIPELQVPGLEGAQTGLIGQFENLGNQYGASGGANPLQQQAGSSLSNFLDQGGQPSAATQQAEKNFSTFQAPQIQQSANLAGLGNSGAALEAEAEGSAQAAVPFLQADQTNQLNAAGQMGQLGGQEFGQQQTALTSALQAAGMPYQIAEQQAQALFNQQQQKQQFGQQVQFGPSQLFPNVIGGGSSTSVNTPSKF